MFHSFRDIYRFQYDVMVSTVNRLREDHEESDNRIAFEVFKEMDHFFEGTKRFMDRFQQEQFTTMLNNLDGLIVRSTEIDE